MPIARRALHGAMADQLPVLPGEVLISRTAVMAPACREGAEAAEEPDMVLGSNRELVVQDVQPERCDLRDFGVDEAPLIDTLTASVEAGETQLQLRLLPPIGSSGRGALETVLTQAAPGGARGRPQERQGHSGGAFFWCVMPLLLWGRRPCSRSIAARAAPSARCSSMGMSSGPRMNGCGASSSMSR